MRKGFTLIEVLVVAVIVAILAAVAIPAYQGYIASSKNKVAKNTAGTIAAACAAYYSEHPTAAAIVIITANTDIAGPTGAVDFDGQSVKMPESYVATCYATYIEVWYTAERVLTSAAVAWR